MDKNKTVTINGRQYDSITGLPIETVKVAARAQPLKPTEQPKAHSAAKSATPANHAADVHTLTQKSKTLHRRAAKKKPTLAKRPQPGRHMDIARSNKIARFAPHPVTAAAPSAPTTVAAPTSQPFRRTPSALATTAPVQPIIAATPIQSPQQSPKQIKDNAIAAALAKPNSSRAPERSQVRWTRRASIFSATAAVIIMAGYITYLNMPSLSVGFASTQAGINASFPKYRPDGFSLAQPITFTDGEVQVKFTSNSGAGEYAITQTRSSWDSSAILDNVVRKIAGDNYITTQERGLTIYSFDNTAVWVNGGIMYKIAANAPLSGDQIRRIAVSL